MKWSGFFPGNNESLEYFNQGVARSEVCFRNITTTKCADQIRGKVAQGPTDVVAVTQWEMIVAELRTERSKCLLETSES